MDQDYWKHKVDTSDQDLARNAKIFVNQFFPYVVIRAAHHAGRIGVSWGSQIDCNISLHAHYSVGDMIVDFRGGKWIDNRWINDSFFCDKFQLACRDTFNYASHNARVTISRLIYLETQTRYGEVLNLKWGRIWANCVSCKMIGDYDAKLCSVVGDKMLCDICIDRYSMQEIQRSISPVKLNRSEKERRKITPSLRWDVLESGNFTCVTCGATAKDQVKMHVDHIIPISKGGKSTKENLQILCETCNLGKSDKIPSQQALEFMGEPF